MGSARSVIREMPIKMPIKSVRNLMRARHYTLGSIHSDVDGEEFEKA